MRLIQQFLGPEAVKAQQPVRLIEPVFPQQGRLDRFGREQGVLHHRDIGRIEHMFELVPIVQSLGQAQDVQIAFRCGADNQLGALSGRSETGSMAVFGQLFPALMAPGLDLPHGGQDGALGLVRG